MIHHYLGSEVFNTIDPHFHLRIGAVSFQTKFMDVSNLAHTILLFYKHTLLTKLVE